MWVGVSASFLCAIFKSLFDPFICVPPPYFTFFAFKPCSRIIRWALFKGEGVEPAMHIILEGEVRVDCLPHSSEKLGKHRSLAVSDCFGEKALVPGYSGDVAGGLLRTSTRPTMNLASSPASLYEHSHAG